MNRFHCVGIKERVVFFVGAVGLGGALFMVPLFIAPLSAEGFKRGAGVEVLENNTWVKKEEVEKTRLYNNGIKETIIINKETGHISIDMRPVKSKPKPPIAPRLESKSKASKKRKSSGKKKVQKKKIGTANIASKSETFESTSGAEKSPEQPAVKQSVELNRLPTELPKVKVVANNQDLMAEMISVLRKNNPQLLPTEKVGVDEFAQINEERGAEDGLRAVNEKAEIQLNSFNQSRARLTRKIEKRKRLARQKIQAQYAASKEKRSVAVQKRSAVRNQRFHNDLAYTCRSEGERIKLEVNYKQLSKNKACEMLYFKSGSYHPLNIGEFQTKQCDVQAKQWLDRQRAWGWQCDPV